MAQTFSSQGSTVFTISKTPQIITSREDFVKFNRRKDVTHEDADAIARLCPSCWRVGIAANAIETVKYANQKAENVRIRGVDPITMFDIDGVSIDAGRIWTESEGASGREICVIGPDMLKNLFGDAPRTRRSARRSGSTAVLISFSACSSRWDRYSVLARQRRLHSLFDLSKAVRCAAFAGRLHSGACGGATRSAKIRSDHHAQPPWPRARRSGRRRVFARNAGRVSESLRLGDFKYLLCDDRSRVYLADRWRHRRDEHHAGVGNGTNEGDRNSQSDRRAPQRHILTQFLIEAVVVTAIGGAIGVGTGFGLAYVISALIGFPLLDQHHCRLYWESAFRLWSESSADCGPAWRARLDPIEALRAE